MMNPILISTLQTPQPVSFAPGLGGQRLAQLTGREPELSGLRQRMTPPLVVHLDDEPATGILITWMLGIARNYHVETFTIAEDALAFCRETRPAVLITDLMRPDIDGITVCRILRDDPDLFDLPLIVLTGDVSIDAQGEVAAIGAEFVAKPCLIGTLVEVVDRAVEVGYLPSLAARQAMPLH